MKEDTKTCKACGQVKPIEEFRQRTGYNSGKPTIFRMKTCRECVRTDTRAKYQTDPLLRARKVLFIMDFYVRKNFPEVWTESVAVNGAKKLVEASGCSYCGLPNDGTWTFSLDHHVPLALGGAHNLDNLYPCCEPCNRAKHDMPPEAFQRWLDGVGLRRALKQAQ